MDQPTIDAVIHAIPEWRGRKVRSSRLAVGLTNANYRVEVDGRPFFVRIPGASTELLAVDRANELANTRAAAAAGAGPRVVTHLPGSNAIVLEWLEAETMSNATLGAAGMPTRIAEVLRVLHAGPRFRDDFDMFRLVERYLEVIDRLAAPVPASYRGVLLPQAPRIETALMARPLPTVPCHNDLLAENYLDDGRRLWIVDYEYSGNNDPTFELGNTAQELGYDDARLAELCAAYFGEASELLIARCRLQMIMSDMGWTLWAAIQARISSIDYDFSGWATERSDRAAAMVEGPDFGRWLRAAAPPA
jgi:thiamine kinase-like enzyme